jgi:diguanylate cyclase (GGDEF)-like protein
MITQILSNQEIQKIVQMMNSNSSLIKNKARETLDVKLDDTYKLLTKYDFRQLHFHDKEGNSFLRFHQKDYFGDNLLNIRPTVRAVHQYKKQVKGFEEGKIVNGFRNVFPIYVGGEFQGSVELSNTFDGISTQLHKNYPFEYKLIIDKNDVNSKLFPELIEKNYRQSTISKNFYEEVKQKSKTKYQVISKREILKIDTIIRKENLLEATKKSSVLDITVGNRDYIVTAIPIYNFDGTVTTYAISYSKNDAMIVIKKEFLFSFVFANLFFLIIYILIKLKFYVKNSQDYAQKAYTDKLTGLYNRQKFEIDYTQFFENGQNKNQLALIIFDIDFFKNVNDTFGHYIGDEVLKQFATITKSVLRESHDFLYRWGGEEFVVLLFNDDLELVSLIAEKIRMKIENTNFGVAGYITGSFGVAVREKNDTMKTLFERVDKNLYRSKQGGRNRVSI